MILQEDVISKNSVHFEQKMTAGRVEGHGQTQLTAFYAIYIVKYV
jgi:hypothetical protein